MMNFDQLAMMTRGGAFALILLIIILIVRDHRHTLAGKIAVLFLVTVLGHLLATIRHNNDLEHIFEWFAEILSNAAPGLFWILARAWFGDERPGWRSWLIVLISSLLMRWHVHALDSGSEELIFLSGLIARAAGVILVLFGLFVAWKGRGDDLIDERRRLRSHGIAAIGLYTILVLLVEIGMRQDGAILPDVLRFWLIFGIFLLALGATISIVRLNRDDLFGPPKMDEPLIQGHRSEIDIGLAERLEQYIQAELAWRNEGLAIGDLARALDIKEYQLRNLINKQLGHRNFAAYLNGYRLKEVKQALVDPSQKDVPILTIALDAGFGSLGPFNRAFRDAEGMTPSQFRAAHLG